MNETRYPQSQAICALGPFDLLRPVARGATARVWRGVHRSSGLAVAVKVLTHVRWRAQRRGGAFERELHTVARFDHPAVVRVHDYGWIEAETAAASQGQLEADCPYLVMDWHGGGSLVSAPRRLEFPQLRRLLLRVLDGLAYIHARGFIHRDIKPANILMGVSGPVLSDLGTAYSLTGAVDTEDEKGIYGTPNYVAPEQVTLKTWMFGPWTDLYALGCLVWKLTTGQPPFRRSNVRKTMAARLSDPLPKFEAMVELPVGFESWLHRLLARQPAERFRFAADAARALIEIDAVADETSSPIVWWGRPGVGDPTTLDEKVFAPTSAEEVIPLLTLTDLEPGIQELESTDGLSARHSAVVYSPTIDWRQGELSPHSLLPDCGRAIALLRVPVMCGREAARDVLWGQLEQVKAGGEARLVVVDGPTGIGKTRLAEWLTHRAHELGMADNVWTQAREANTRGSGLWSMLPRRISSHSKTLTDFISHTCAAIGVSREDATAIAAYGPIPSPSHTVIGEREAFLGIQAALEALCRRRPLILVVDDAQRDDTALRFVQHALASLRCLPILFVVSADRGAEGIDPRTQRRIEALVNGANIPPIVLGPLDTSTTADVIDRWLALAPDVREALCRVIRGNPLHASVVIQHWLESDSLADSSVGYRVRPGHTLTFPANLVEAWRLRLESALEGESSDIESILELAAVLRSPIPLPILSTVAAAVDLPEQDRWLPQLLSTDILRLSDASEVELSHPVLADALIEHARDRGRLEYWHSQCADALAATVGGDSRSGERIARHLAAAGRHREAVSQWLDVCLSARTNGELDRYHTAILNAARVFRRLRRPRTDPRWIRIKQDWAGRSTHLKSIDHALRHARQALALARRGGHIAAVAELLRSLARRWLAVGELDTAQELLEEAREICTELEEPAIMARVLLTTARLALQQGRDIDSWELAIEAARWASSIDDRHTLAIAVNIRGELARRRGDLEAAARAYREVASVAQRAEYVVLAHCNLALVYLERGQIDAAESLAEASLWEADRLALPFTVVAANVVILVCAAQKGSTQAWERAWMALEGVRALKILEFDIARYLEMAAHIVAARWPNRAIDAASLAARVFEKLGYRDESSAVRTWMKATFGVDAEAR